jgi:ribulose-5-phosphate 4-epimerase/fuculose-1-phosphate aldolase
MSVNEVAQSRNDTEWNVRVDLAACYRLVALYGWDDLIFTHISARSRHRQLKRTRDGKKRFF